jgi:pilus assembly protein CpaE
VARKGADIAIIEVSAGSGEGQALDCISQLLRLAPGISVVATGPADSADLVIRAIRAGAIEFLQRPISKEELGAAVEKMQRLRRAPSTPETGSGTVLSLYAIKGGLGLTTLATNLAVSLAQKKPDQVLLVDLELGHGSVGTLLNLHSPYTVVDAFGQTARLDEAFLRGLLVRHKSGLHVLAAPATIERGRFTPEQIREGLGVIRKYFSRVVLDLPHDLDPGTTSALEDSDEILYMVGLNVPAVRNAGAGLQAMKHLGIDQRKIKVVVSRADSREEVSLRQAREALGVPVFWRIPNDYGTVLSSINEGEPFVVSSPRTEVARSVRQLGDKLSQDLEKGGTVHTGSPSLFRRVLPRMV